MKVKRAFKYFVCAVVAVLAAIAVVGCAGDNTGTEEPQGEFFTLQQAYDGGYLSREDLQNIASYHNNNKNYPENLKEEIAEAIKKDWAKKLSDSDNSTEVLTAEDIAINEYYGTYSGSVAIIVDRKDAQYIDKYAPYSKEIGEVSFSYSYPRPEIRIWTNGQTEV